MIDFALALCTTVGLFVLVYWLHRRTSRPDSTDGTNLGE